MEMKYQCESCSMPIESGPYCHHCVDEKGELQAFNERYERMRQWSASRNPDASPEDIARDTLAYMSTLPAWKDHPELLRLMKN